MKSTTPISVTKPLKKKNGVVIPNIEHLKPFMLWLNQDFRAEVQAIREKFLTEPNESEGYSKEHDEELMKFWENAYLEDEVEILRKKFKLSKRWTEFLIRHVVFGDTYASYDIDGLLLETTEGEDGEKEFSLLLTSETTLNDVILAWPQIAKKIGSGNKRRKPQENFWRDFTIYQMSKRGRSLDEIYREVKEKYDQDLDYGNIKKINTTFKKKVAAVKKS